MFLVVIIFFFLICSSWESSSSYAEQNCIPDIGTKVMGWFPKQEQWCRAQVTKICGVSKGGCVVVLCCVVMV